nr:3-hydroxyacyl-CoA dehydrogenase NAD-binding domain-containing protein [uncultured Celeribacter sp.]
MTKVNLYCQQIYWRSYMKRIVVVGAGIMGARICRHFLCHGLQVALVDPSEDARKKAQETLQTPEQKPVFAQAANQLAEAWRGAEIVFEVVPEVLSLKRKVFAELEAFFETTTVIASNTSGLRTSELAADLRHPERFLIAHFFNPADLIPAVEIVPGDTTTEETVTRVSTLLTQTGKKPACLQADIPGFIANRLQHALLRECFHLMEAGVADAQTIDLVTRYSLGVRLALIGPLLQRDLNGLETHLNIATYLYPDLDARKTPSPILTAKVEAGAFGRKSGEGFYHWDETQIAQMEQIEALLPEVVALSGKTDAEKEE